MALPIRYLCGVALDEQDSNGTLETWGYNWLIKLDPDEIGYNSIVLSSRGMDEDGYFSQTNGQFFLAQHYTDGSYDILGEVSFLDAVDFLAQHNGSGETIYDWYCGKEGYFSYYPGT